MHTYTVEIRMMSQDFEFDIDAISNNLGIIANNTRKRGEPKTATSTKVFAESMWGYTVHPENTVEDWDSLEDGLQSLMDIFLPLKDKITQYLVKYEVVIWCGHFTSSFDGGPALSAEILKKLGEFGVPLYLDTYCCADEECPE